MTRTDKLQEAMTDMWTVDDVAERFGVTVVSVHNWRVLDDPIPALVIPGRGRPALRFVPDDVRAWATRNNKEMRES